MDKAWTEKDELIKICQGSGFSYITIDLNGYRTGSMNEVLPGAYKLDYRNLA